MQNNNNQYRIRTNFQIKAPQVRVIQEDGYAIGVMSIREALKLAQDQGLDLVEVNGKAIPPVCKLINYGKFKYDEKKRQVEAKKKQKNQELKELSFRPNTDENDLLHKLAFAKDFLKDGNKVKFTIRFRGREIVHPQIAKDKLFWIVQQLNDLILPNPEISSEGKFMWMIVSPAKN